MLYDMHTAETSSLELERATPRPAGYWPLQVGAWLAFAAAMSLGHVGEMPGTAILLVDGPYAALGFVATLVLYRCYRVVHVAEGSAARTVAIVTLGSWIVAMLWTAIFHRYLHGFAVPSIARMHPGVELPIRRGPVLDNTVYNTLTLLAWSTLYLGLLYRDQLQAQRDQALRAAAEAKDAQLRMLAYQLNPHFLFNALNSLRAMIDEDRTRARRMVTELAGFLRYALVERPLQLAPLGEEVAAVRGYLAIEAIRFEERLEVQVEVTPEAAECRVPAFLLNPLVENAVKHGRPTDGGVLRLRVRGSIDADAQLVLEVENSGALALGESRAPDGDRVGGVGLRNVRARLAHHFPGRHAIALVEDEGTVRVTITMPAAREAAPATSHAPLLAVEAPRGQY